MMDGDQLPEEEEEEYLTTRSGRPIRKSLRCKCGEYLRNCTKGHSSASKTQSNNLKLSSKDVQLLDYSKSPPENNSDTSELTNLASENEVSFAANNSQNNNSTSNNLEMDAENEDDRLLDNPQDDNNSKKLKLASKDENINPSRKMKFNSKNEDVPLINAQSTQDNNHNPTKRIKLAYKNEDLNVTQNNINNLRPNMIEYPVERRKSIRSLIKKKVCCCSSGIDCQNKNKFLFSQNSYAIFEITPLKSNENIRSLSVPPCLKACQNIVSSVPSQEIEQDVDDPNNLPIEPQEVIDANEDNSPIDDPQEFQDVDKSNNLPIDPVPSTSKSIQNSVGLSTIQDQAKEAFDRRRSSRSHAIKKCACCPSLDGLPSSEYRKVATKRFSSLPSSVKNKPDIDAPNPHKSSQLANDVQAEMSNSFKYRSIKSKNAAKGFSSRPSSVKNKPDAPNPHKSSQLTNDVQAETSNSFKSHPITINENYANTHSSNQLTNDVPSEMPNSLKTTIPIRRSIREVSVCPQIPISTLSILLKKCSVVLDRCEVLNKPKSITTNSKKYKQRQKKIMAKRKKRKTTRRLRPSINRKYNAVLKRKMIADATKQITSYINGRRDLCTVPKGQPNNQIPISSCFLQKFDEQYCPYLSFLLLEKIDPKKYYELIKPKDNEKSMVPSFVARLLNRNTPCFVRLERLNIQNSSNDQEVIAQQEVQGTPESINLPIESQEVVDLDEYSDSSIDDPQDVQDVNESVNTHEVQAVDEPNNLPIETPIVDLDEYSDSSIDDQQDVQDVNESTNGTIDPQDVNESTNRTIDPQVDDVYENSSVYIESLEIQAACEPNNPPIDSQDVEESINPPNDPQEFQDVDESHNSPIVPPEVQDMNDCNNLHIEPLEVINLDEYSDSSVVDPQEVGESTNRTIDPQVYDVHVYSCLSIESLEIQVDESTNSPIDSQDVENVEESTNSPIGLQEDHAVDESSNLPIDSQDVEAVEESTNSPIGLQEDHAVDESSNLPIDSQDVEAVEESTNSPVGLQEDQAVDEFSNLPIDSQDVEECTNSPIELQKVQAVDESSNSPIDPQDIYHVEESTNSPIDPQDAQDVEESTNSPIDPQDVQDVEESTNSPIDPQEGQAVDESSNASIDPQDAQDMEESTNSPVDRQIFQTMEESSNSLIDPQNFQDVEESINSNIDRVPSTSIEDMQNEHIEANIDTFQDPILPSMPIVDEDSLNFQYNVDNNYPEGNEINVYDINPSSDFDEINSDENVFIRMFNLNSPIDFEGTHSQVSIISQMHTIDSPGYYDGNRPEDDIDSQISTIHLAASVRENHIDQNAVNQLFVNLYSPPQLEENDDGSPMLEDPFIEDSLDTEPEPNAEELENAKKYAEAEAAANRILNENVPVSEYVFQDSECVNLVKNFPEIVMCCDCIAVYEFGEADDYSCRFISFRKFPKHCIYESDSNMSFTLSPDETRDNAVTVRVKRDQYKRTPELKELIYKARHVFPQFLTLLLQEVQTTFSLIPQFIRPFTGGYRDLCDCCCTSIFNRHWICKHCGYLICIICYKEFVGFTKSNKTSRINCEMCITKSVHIMDYFILVEIIPREQIRFLLKKIASYEFMLAVETLHEKALEPKTPINIDRNSSPSTWKINTNELDKWGIPYDLICDERVPRLLEPNHLKNLALFRKFWVEGISIVVSGLDKEFKNSLWSPRGFMKDFKSNQNCDVIDCKTSKAFTYPLKNFWNGFTNDKKKRIDRLTGLKYSLKIKDFPSTADLKDVFPDRFEDFYANIPMPSYTQRTGFMNLANHLPEAYIRPDLGPKLYVAYSTIDGSKSEFASTNLHLDLTDAVNVMTYARNKKSEKNSKMLDELEKLGVLQDYISRVESDRLHGKPPNHNFGAIWHIFHAKDSEKIRELLRKVTQETDKGLGLQDQDPIHEQSWYIDDELRKRLRDEYNVVGYNILQFVGDAVFIPAGAAHQVRNLKDCVKIATDFFSVENLPNTISLIDEFRKIAFIQSGTEDKLQVYNTLFHATTDCVKSLDDYLKKNGTNN